MDFFQKGGGIRADPKFLGHFLCTNNFGILGRKGRGWTKSKSFWALFTLILVKYDTKSAPKVPEKNQRTKKCPKSSKSLGGGVKSFWKNSIIKLPFFFRRSEGHPS